MSDTADNYPYPWCSKDPCSLIFRGRPFVKMHGLRNDFVIVDGRDLPYTPSVEEIISICDRHEGVGADELLIVEPPKSEGTTAFVRIINPDGRDVEACGNASRCVGWLLLKEIGAASFQKEKGTESFQKEKGAESLPKEKGTESLPKEKDTESLQFETLGGILTCALAGEKKVTVGMGKVKTSWQEIPLSREMETLHLGIAAGPLKDPVGMNIGNPHAVFFVDDFDGVDLARYGKELQTHSLFPEEANIGVARVLNPDTMKLTVWERPGILTTACGSGACAAVAAARRRGLTSKNSMKVIMPGGSVTIELKDDDTVMMTGPVEICYGGYLPLYN